jgi:hypothetical protein
LQCHHQRIIFYQPAQTRRVVPHSVAALVCR